jgi:endonuclease-3
MQYRLNAHHWLILHGRHVCKARKPECWVCVVRDLCRYKAKTIPEEAIVAPKGKIGTGNERPSRRASAKRSSG